MSQLDAKLLEACKKLDERMLMPPDEIMLLGDDESFMLRYFSDIAPSLDELSDTSKSCLLRFANALLSLEDDRLYAFSVIKGLTLELDADIDTHFVETAKDKEGHIKHVEYVINLAREPEPTMINSLAHEAAHNLDIVHFATPRSLEEYSLHSGNPVFQVCYDIDYTLHPNGLAQKIHRTLEERNYTVPALMENGMNAEEAEKRMFEERFALMVEYFTSDQPLPESHLLQTYYDAILDLDLDLGTGKLSPETIAEKRKFLMDHLNAPPSIPSWEPLQRQNYTPEQGHFSKKAIEEKTERLKRDTEDALIHRMIDMRLEMENQLGTIKPLYPKALTTRNGNRQNYDLPAL